MQHTKIVRNMDNVSRMDRFMRRRAQQQEQPKTESRQVLCTCCGVETMSRVPVTAGKSVWRWCARCSANTLWAVARYDDGLWLLVGLILFCGGVVLAALFFMWLLGVLS